LLKGGPLLELSRHPGWLSVLARGLRHSPYCLEAVEGGLTRGFLALAFVRSLLFGRYLVSLPYLNYGGVHADGDAPAGLVSARRAGRAARLGVRRLELRHEPPVGPPRLGQARTDKAHMRLDLPGSAEALWKQLDGKVRNQVNKGRKHGLEVAWGGV